MSFSAVAQTPQRPLPGAFMMTPALANRRQSTTAASSIFSPAPSAPTAQDAGRQVAQQQTQIAASQRPGTAAPTNILTWRATTLLGKGADNLQEGISSEYDISANPAWVPFQKVKLYDIPERIFDQYNEAQGLSTNMGLFAELNHAWFTIDNSLYLWDYTHPNPDMIGFEEQPHAITSVKLVRPRAGVFVNTITHVLVVSTTSDIILIGVSSQPGPGGSHTVTLYQTRMQVPIKGLGVSCIDGSARSGRIFFAGKASNSLYELTYQQEEKWFQNRCGKINHTAKGFTTVLPTFGSKAPPEYVKQIAVDDTRNLVYTLSSTSTIRVFHMKPGNVLDLIIARPLAATMKDISHMVSRSELLVPGTTITSISPMSATETSRVSLMGTTSTGCRLFFSATSGTYYSSDSSTAPTSMQVHHVKFPPALLPGQTSSSRGPSTQMTAYQSGAPVTDLNSRSLTGTRTSIRYAPGYFFCFVRTDQNPHNDILFMSAPDSGRIKGPQEVSSATKFAESAMWNLLGGNVEDVGLVTPPFAASASPLGFGNELAVQFDQPAAEVAVLTSTGIQTIRRRRLVDIFAAAIRYGGGEDGLEGEVRKFARMYGRGETTATALAVACGQGLDVTSDARVAKITDPEILEYARKAFIDFGGRATLNENSVVDNGSSAIDNVRPSPRHEGIALYISRLVRSIWRAPLIREAVTPLGGLVVLPTVPLSKLQIVQRDLTQLQEFLDKNKSLIDGLAGPEALGRVATKQDEIALQGEHRALNALVRLILSVIEGISFVLVLFDERVEEIVLSLSDSSRQRVRQLTYEGLFCTSDGKDLAKELVKAIVNRNIANGSNVDTIAEALRRRCGSFCSADDVVTFKAQEQLKKASENGANSESGRILLNESLKLFQKVAASLTMENLQWAVEQYVSMAFYAAQETDRANRALAWIKDDFPQQDSRQSAFESRKRCYDLIHRVITAVDQASSQAPEMLDGDYTTTAKRRSEAYDVINNSDDEVFQTSLYDWYLSQGWKDRLLEISSPYVVAYLQRKSIDDVDHADLLWRYYAHYNSFFEAAEVQLMLAKSAFDLTLEQRIEYLSRAKTNASTRTMGMREVRSSRQSRQELLREVSELLDVANLQEDILQRLKQDTRFPDAERKAMALKQLNGPVLSLEELFNGYADQAEYYDLMILMYEAADHRNPSSIRATWQNLLDQVHTQTVNEGSPQPWEAVSEKTRSLGIRLNLADITFPVHELLPMLEKYAFEHQRGKGPATWVVDTFLDLSVPYETVLPILEAMFYNDEAPFEGRNRKYIANDMLYVIHRWFVDSSRSGTVVFGSDENAAAISETLKVLLQNGGMDEARVEQCELLRVKIDLNMR
ncbi:hypothetical protein LTR04_007040 [Oleoguttula sp. CCFEE 6159]|nr:hypothetical protein LTR04_007040 [Oleoguttula sp. CCFEE 6159]